MTVGQPALRVISFVVSCRSSYSMRVRLGIRVFLFRMVLLIEDRPSNALLSHDVKRYTVIPCILVLPFTAPFPGVRKVTVTPLLLSCSPSRSACHSAPPAGRGGKEATIMIVCIRIKLMLRPVNIGKGAESYAGEAFLSAESKKLM